MGCLRLPSASWIGQGYLGTRGGGELICVYGVTKAVCLHVKEDFLGKRRIAVSGGLWRGADKATQANAFDRGRCICLWYRIAPGPGPPGPCPNPLSPAPRRPPVYSVRKQTVTLPTPYQSHVDLEGVNVRNCPRVVITIDDTCKFNYQIGAVRGSISWQLKGCSQQRSGSYEHIQQIILLYFLRKPSTCGHEVFVSTCRILMSPVCCRL